MKVDRILQITNDLNEGIDNHYPREQLAACVKYWSKEAGHFAQRHAAAEFKLSMLRTLLKSVEPKEEA
jgi:hypothetical protein